MPEVQEQKTNPSLTTIDMDIAQARIALLEKRMAVCEVKVNQSKSLLTKLKALFARLK